MSTASDKFEGFTGFTAFSTVGPSRAADYWALEEGAPYELIRGRLIMSPCPTPLHQILSGVLYELLSTAARKTDSVVMYSPIDVVFSDDTILQPDVLFVTQARREIITSKNIVGPPDLAVEIVSPGTGRREKTEKLDLYAKYGVPEYWIVDPATQLFEFLLLNEAKSGGKYVIEQQPDDQYRSSLLPEIEIDLAAFWAEVERRFPRPKSSL